MVTRRTAFARSFGLPALAVLALFAAPVGFAVAAPAAGTANDIPALPTVTTTPGDAPTQAPATGDPATGTPATGNPATGTPATGTPATGTPVTGTPVTGNPTAPATGDPAAGTAGTPAAGTPNAAGAPTAGTPETAATKTQNDDHLAAWTWGAIGAAIVLVAALGWALVVATGRIPGLAPVGHAMGEAGWRLSLRWAEFTDWLRFGSGR